MYRKLTNQSERRDLKLELFRSSIWIEFQVNCELTRKLERNFLHKHYSPLPWWKSAPNTPIPNPSKLSRRSTFSPNSNYSEPYQPDCWLAFLGLKTSCIAYDASRAQYSAYYSCRVAMAWNSIDFNWNYKSEWNFHLRFAAMQETKRWRIVDNIMMGWFDRTNFRSFDFYPVWCEAPSWIRWSPANIQ